MGPREFIALTAALMSLVALTIDIMVPALGHMAADLQVAPEREGAWVITSLFLGMSGGLAVFGPLSDAYGRRRMLLTGLTVYIAGCLLSRFAPTLEIMLIGRVVQGIGVSAAQVLPLAMVRDRYQGEAMAHVMSVVLLMFLTVPAFAPILGHLIVSVGTWRDIFAWMLMFAAGTLVWFGWRAPETLPAARRHPFTLGRALEDARQTLSNRDARAYMSAAAMIHGAFVGYLVTAQPLLEGHYQLGTTFPYVFGAMAVPLGVASYLNARWVESLGMVWICVRALLGIIVASVAFLTLGMFVPLSLPLVLAYLALTLFGVGFVFGNINALATRSLGHIAGVANSVLGVLQSVASVVLGGTIGWWYEGSAAPLMVGFLSLSGVALAAMVWAESRPPQTLESP